MAENFKVVRECRRLETNINVPPVDNNFHIRTLQNRNIPYDTRHRQMDRQTSRGQKSNIPLRPNSFKTSCKIMTSDISTQPPSNKDETIGRTVRQEHLQIPIPAQRHER